MADVLRKHDDKDRSAQHDAVHTMLVPATAPLGGGSSSLEGSLTVAIVKVADPADSGAEGIKLVFTDERPVFCFVGDASADFEGDVTKDIIATGIDEEEASRFSEAVGTGEALTESTWLLLNEVSLMMWH
jgi:hypothetical protein